jgi:Glycosyl transferases group 1/Glycosyl transferase 4-like domain
LTSLHIDTGMGMRGGQWQALYLLGGLIEKGQSVRLLAPAGSPLLLAALAQRIEARPLGWRALISAARGSDLIHAHDARAHTLAVLARKPAVISRRVAFAVKRNPASRWKYHGAAHFIAVSECVRQKLMEAGIDPVKITVVYDGVPVPEFVKTVERTRMLALDLDDAGKGKTLIQQAAALADIPVHFSRNLLRDLPDAALFVYITDLEGFGSAALLAMAHGAPVLASRVGGLPEMIEDGVDGLLTANDAEAIALGMRRLMTDRALASRLAAQARARVEKEFSVTRMVSATLGVYERILT